MIKKIIDKENSNQKILAKDIPVGQVFKGQIGEYKDNLFLKAYHTIVSLNNPKSVWGKFFEEEKDPLNFTVENYQPVEIEIKIL